MDKQQFFNEKYAGFVKYVPMEKVLACAKAIDGVSAQCAYEIAEYLVKCQAEKYALFCCDKRVALTDQYETYREASKWFRENIAVQLEDKIRNFLIYDRE